MKITESDINREGFAVLHGKWGGSNKIQTMVGVNGRMKNEELRMKNEEFSIGYLAYSNPTLKNDIPGSRFYQYDEILCRRDVGAPAGVNMDYKTSGCIEKSVSKSEYIQKIKQIKELLTDGEIYQMNYAIRFRKKFSGNPYGLFLKLVKNNPSDFAAYLNCSDFQIISSSPELLFKVKDGNIVTQPIKGTAPKVNGLDLSAPLRSGRGDINLVKLLNSEKEKAELDMITDLERNDVGKICEYGTLKLAKKREIMELANIWHTYSEIRGKLQSNISLEEIINAMFPGGSITGCPKKRAMEYIEKLEGLPRNIFTGSIGFISPKEMIFNITIRTALLKDGYIEYWAGGGIVADSDPEKEYKECILKAEKFLAML